MTRSNWMHTLRCCDCCYTARMPFLFLCERKLTAWLRVCSLSCWWYTLVPYALVRVYTLFGCAYVCVGTCLFACLSVCLSVYLFVCIYWLAMVRFAASASISKPPFAQLFAIKTKHKQKMKKIEINQPNSSNGNDFQFHVQIHTAHTRSKESGWITFFFREIVYPVLRTWTAWFVWLCVCGVRGVR